MRQPVWALGLAMMISGEIGNLLAYGDPNTPTSVVVAVGSVGTHARARSPHMLHAYASRWRQASRPRKLAPVALMTGRMRAWAGE